SAWRRKLRTDTPAMACGYWKARNIPALPRTSVGHAVMSSPWKSSLPCVTSYSGLASSVEARVDLPDPFGPIRAWTSPWRTVRSIPFRIPLPSTDAWSPSISRVAASTAVCVCACVSAVTVHLDQDVVTFQLHREHLDRHGRR